MKEFFNNLLLDNALINFSQEPIILSSGEESNTYVNWRNILTDAFSVDKLSDYIISIVKEKNLDPDSFYGVPESMSLIGGITQLKWASQSNNYQIGSHTLSIGRGKPKEHGAEEDKYFIGKPTGKTIILEDVIKTGKSLLKEIRNIEDKDCQVISAIALTDRMETSKRDCFNNELKSLRVKYYPLSFLVKSTLKNGDFLIPEN